MVSEIPHGCPACGALPCDQIADPEKYLLNQLYKIRKAMGVMEKPMLSELPEIIAARWFKPISLAPKDGTHLYLYIFGAGLVHAFWDKNEALPKGFWRSAATGKQCGYHAEWFILFDELTPDAIKKQHPDIFKK